MAHLPPAISQETDRKFRVSAKGKIQKHQKNAESCCQPSGVRMTLRETWTDHFLRFLLRWQTEGAAVGQLHDEDAEALLSGLVTEAELHLRASRRQPVLP